MPWRWPSRNAAGLAVFVTTAMVAVAMFVRVNGQAGHELVLGFPTAIVAGALLLRPRWWPLCFLLVAAFEPLAGVDKGQAVAGDLAEASWVAVVAVVAWLLIGRTRFSPSLSRVRDLLWFSAFALVVPMATAGIQGLFDHRFTIQLLADVSAMCWVTPGFLVLGSRPLAAYRPRRVHVKSLAEGLAQAGCMLVPALLAASDRLDRGLFSYLVFAVTIWIAVRWGITGTVAAVVGATAMILAISGTGLDTGRAGTEMPVFLVVFSLTRLLLGASISERSRSESVRRQLAAIVEATSDFVATTDASGRVLYLNRAARRLRGLSPDADVDHLELRELALLAETALPTAKADGTWHGETAMIDANGHEVPVSQLVISHPPTPDGTEVFSAVARDISERKRVEAQLARQALHDPLTGLPNRTLFLDRLEGAMSAGRASLCGVLFLDLDRFKVVNDSLGHEVGDRLLVAVARRLERTVRPSDTLARLGGDEFTVLVEGMEHEIDAVAAAERILRVLHLPFVIDGHEVFVSASIGIVPTLAESETAGQLLRQADLAMYRAKETGRSRYALFDDEMNRAAIARLEMETEIRRAVELGEFDLLYQPAFDATSGRVHTVEALLRWHHPVLGDVPPRDIVPLAEETGLIVPIGRWVLQEACRQAAAWDSAGGGEPPMVAVNVSAPQIQRPQFLDDVVSVLELTGLPPSRLMLEITESLLMGDRDGTSRVLTGLRRIGVKIAIDDFGTGYSSFSYLRRLPVDVIKLDRSFITGLGESDQDRAVVVAIVELAHALDLRVVAEGVETEAQLEALRLLGCDVFQGFLLARPMAVGELGGALSTGMLERCAAPLPSL